MPSNGGKTMKKLYNVKKKIVKHQKNAKRSQEEVGPNQINNFCSKYEKYLLLLRA